MFEDNKYDPAIEPLFDDIKYEESNPYTWNVFDDSEVDTKVDINKPNINQIEDPWFNDSNATYKE